jgi:threonine dehydrogenase-like Zn-dependent dehydrogenase
MKALVYHGPRNVSVDRVADARIEKHTDVLVRITTTNICGSDLHMYEGRTDMPPDSVLGHENFGEVIEIGEAVDRVKVGDYVAIPFNIGCGFCANCERGLSAYCLTTADRSVIPNMAGAAYGFADMGPYRGGQAELLRVPYGDYNCLVLPEDAKEKERDYVMLSDIFPTGWHATRMATLTPGDSVVIYGAGPVGLMATISASIQGASQIFVVDHNTDRLKVAKSLGAIPVVEDEGREVGQILDATGGEGTDCGCECIGYQCTAPKGREVPNLVMNSLVNAVKFTGGIGVVGVFIPQDPGAADDLAKKGEIAFDFGKFWFKGQKVGTGQCNVKAYNRKLMELIHHNKAKPSSIISHELPLTEAPIGYKNFDQRLEGWRKVVLHPQAA